MPGNNRCRESSRVDHESPRVGGKEGDRKASRVAENPRGSRHRVGEGVKSPQGADTPGVAEFPRGDKTPGGTTATKVGPREDRRGRGEDRTPPTARATRAQGADGVENGPMGEPRTAEPPRPQRSTEAYTDSAENQPRHTAGTNGARPKHGALTRHEYGFLAPAGTVVDHADAGDTGSEAGHGATTDQDGTDQEEEGDKTLQLALPA